MTLDARIVRRALGAALVAGVLGLAACGDDESDSSADVPPTTASTTNPKDVCEEATAPEPKDVKLDKPSGNEVKPGEKVTAKVETNCGDFEIALDTKGSPKTTSSFVHMVEEGLYDGTSFHRVVEDFVIQGGDPAADGTGGPGYSVTEAPPPNTEYTKGVVAMAKSGVEPPGTSGSQFFVVVGADAGLPADYAVLGEITGSDAAVERIAAQAVPGQDGPPAVPVVIDRITLER